MFETIPCGITIIMSRNLKGFFTIEARNWENKQVFKSGEIRGSTYSETVQRCKQQIAEMETLFTTLEKTIGE